MLGLLMALGMGPTYAGDELLYYIEDQQLVFTNSPDGHDAKPVPGLETDPPDHPRQTTSYDGLIREAADAAGVPTSLVRAVARVESGFNPRAVSPKGAKGLMQLMPATALHYGVTDAFDPRQNLAAGAIHLSNLLNEFDDDLNLALAAYNAGQTAVHRHGGVPDYPETRKYVLDVRAHMEAEPDWTRPVANRPRTPLPASDVRLVQHADGTVELVNVPADGH
jgi:hypothetical protein